MNKKKISALILSCAISSQVILPTLNASATELNNTNNKTIEKSTSKQNTSNLEGVNSNKVLEENNNQEITDNLTKGKNTENKSKKVNEEKIKQNETKKVVNKDQNKKVKTKATTNLKANEIVNIPDQNLKKALNEKLKQNENSNITKKQLESLTLVSLYKKNISNLEGLQYCINLKELNLSSNQIGDVSPLKALTNLSVLKLDNNKLNNIDSLKNLTNLTWLSLSSNQISDINPLKSLNNLTALQLGSNQISDISPLSNLTNLTNLSLFSNKINNINSLRNLNNLTTLQVSLNQISDISPLKGLTNLKTLSLANQEILSNPLQITNGNAETDNIIKGINNEFIAPTNIIPNGVYDKNSNKIKWTNLNIGNEVNYSFNNKVTIGNATTMFSGRVSMKVANGINEKPVIHVENKTIKQGESFNPLEGVTATDKEDGNITDRIKVIVNDVDTNAPGVYRVVYEVTDSQGAKATRTIGVKVVSKFKPLFSGVDNVTIKEGTAFDPMAGVTAKDLEDDDVTNKIKVTGKVDTSKTGKYELTYTVTDTDGNTTTVKRIVTVIANTENINEKPVIHAENKTIKVGSKFNLMDGVTATDKEDGNITNKIKVVESTVNLSKPGTYKVVYEVTDSHDEKTRKTITITVVNNDKPVSNESNNITNTNKPTTNNSTPSTNESTSSSNDKVTLPATGATSSLPLVGSILVGIGGLFASKKKKNK